MVAYVIRAEDLRLLNELPRDLPPPVALEWINRGTNQVLKPTTVRLLVRTLYRNIEYSESVRKLHQSSGLRVRFQSEPDRARFAAAFEAIRPRGVADDA